MSNFLSGVAVLLSTLALLFGGFSTYKIFTLEQKIDSVINTASGGTNSVGTPSSNSVNTTPTNQVNSPNSTANTAPVTPTAGNTNTQATSGASVQPGQFVQPAFSNSGQVELLAVKRIKDPQTGRGDIVNVQFRLRRLTEQFPAGSSLYAGATTARNPDTSETYQPADAINHATDTVLLTNVRIGTSVDAYVWMRIPEGVTTVDLLFENTQAFKNVPIS